jgi:hypothetical protein
MGSDIKSKIYSKKIIVAVAAIVATGIIVFVWANKEVTNTKKDINTQSSQTAGENNEKQKTEYLSYQGEDGKTAMELLKSEAEVETKSSSLGDYVTSINGNDGGGSKFWLFYIDGKEASVGADKYVTKSGETIEWKLQ